jgi:rare lipoprotein A
VPPPVRAETPVAKVDKPVAKVDKPDTPRIPAERPAASANGGWSVQVAAYNTRAEGEKFAATLEARGYDARVDGTVKPFRVRIGRYSTAAEANAALAKIKAKRMDGFVTRAQ